MEDKTIIGGLVGCGLLSVLSCCAFGFAFYFIGVDQQAEWDEDILAIPVDEPDYYEPAPAPALPPGPAAAPQLAVTLEVTSTSGSAPFSNGASCTFRIEPSSELGCHGVLTCGEHHVYGGLTSGFFPCDWNVTPQGNAAMAGGDSRTTSDDTDGAMSINTGIGRLSFSDDQASAFGVYGFEARVTDAQVVLPQVQ